MIKHPFLQHAVERFAEALDSYAPLVGNIERVPAAVDVTQALLIAFFPLTSKSSHCTRENLESIIVDWVHRMEAERDQVGTTDYEIEALDAHQYYPAGGNPLGG